MKLRSSLLFVFLSVVIASAVVYTRHVYAQPNVQQYLPLIARSEPQSSISECLKEPAEPIDNIMVIERINLSNEGVFVRNTSTATISLRGWFVCSVTTGHDLGVIDSFWLRPDELGLISAGTSGRMPDEPPVELVLYDAARNVRAIYRQ